MFRAHVLIIGRSIALHSLWYHHTYRCNDLFHNKFYFMPLHVSSTCAHNQEVKIALQSLWYHYTYRRDDAKGCDDEHMCSKHV